MGREASCIGLVMGHVVVLVWGIYAKEAKTLMRALGFGSFLEYAAWTRQGGEIEGVPRSNVKKIYGLGREREDRISIAAIFAAQFSKANQWLRTQRLESRRLIGR